MLGNVKVRSVEDPPKKNPRTHLWENTRDISNKMKSSINVILNTILS